ncbi:hypothetical protein B0H14DRAFT_2571805 [Mycena olivaceomarginata]|nr:hypothetical protein B0H14DRAFT_2571805 [Mycena olivaceomarginata]
MGSQGQPLSFFIRYDRVWEWFEKSSARQFHSLLYGESYKFLELNSSTGYYFFTDETIDELEALLATGTPESPAILALYTDLPGNPHLRTADLKRLRALANQYNF